MTSRPVSVVVIPALLVGFYGSPKNFKDTSRDAVIISTKADCNISTIQTEPLPITGVDCGEITMLITGELK